MMKLTKKEREYQKKNRELVKKNISKTLKIYTSMELFDLEKPRWFDSERFLPPINHSVLTYRPGRRPNEIWSLCRCDDDSEIITLNGESIRNIDFFTFWYDHTDLKKGKFKMYVPFWMPEPPVF